ncbi:MAG: DUF4139 domain-containing protein [Verrucomicrobia bacterium]|nr:DUF4139 domain-containing protein [Verrucomicrobiota bacterium]
MLPGATWEPVHELRATPDGQTVALASFAVVMQTTGEDWLDAKLSPSPSATASPETHPLPPTRSASAGSARQRDSSPPPGVIHDPVDEG